MSNETAKHTDEPASERSCPDPSGSPCWERGYNFDTGHHCRCGGDLYISDNADGKVYDCDEYECDTCGEHGAFTIYSNGVKWADPFEDNMKELFQIICQTKQGKELTLCDGNMFTEREADNLVKACRGGISEQVGNVYFARKVMNPRPKDDNFSSDK